MRFEWVRPALAAVAITALAGCGAVFGVPEKKEAQQDPTAAAIEAMRAQMEAQQPQAADPAAMKAFLERNAKQPGVTVLPSGVQYRVERSGPAGGKSPKVGDEVKFHYEGALIDGTVFDSSLQRGQPVDFRVGELVPGFNEALTLMKPGDSWFVYIPADQGYGDRPSGQIPPGSVLVFKLQLISVLPQSETANG